MMQVLSKLDNPFGKYHRAWCGIRTISTSYHNIEINLAHYVVLIRHYILCLASRHIFKTRTLYTITQNIASSNETTNHIYFLQAPVVSAGADVFLLLIIISSRREVVSFSMMHVLDYFLRYRTKITIRNHLWILSRRQSIEIYKHIRGA